MSARVESGSIVSPTLSPLAAQASSQNQAVVDPILKSGCPRQPDNIIDDDFPVRVDPHVVTHFQRAVGFAIQLKGDRTARAFSQAG
jgi:hypothetical protein